MTETTTPTINPAVKSFLADAGRKGGTSKTPRKSAASARNAAAARAARQARLEQSQKTS